MEIKISVIMPAYNAGKKIKRSIESVLNQKFVSWELIIVNDNSSDDTLEIINKYQKKDVRIKVINKNINERAFKARLDGVKNATANWLCFLDADDYLYPEALNKLYESTRSGCEIIIGSYCNTYDRFGFTRTFPINLIPNKLISGKFDISDNELDLDLAFYGKHSIPVSSCSRLINKDLFSEINYDNLPNIHSFDDTLLNLLLFEKTSHVFFIKDKIIDYRYGGGTRNVDPRTLSDLNELYKIRTAKIKENFKPDRKKYSDIEYMNTIYHYYFNGILIENWDFKQFKNNLNKNIDLEFFNYLKKEYQNYNNKRFNLFFQNMESNPRVLYDYYMMEVKKVKFKRLFFRKMAFILSKI